MRITKKQINIIEGYLDDSTSCKDFIFYLADDMDVIPFKMFKLIIDFCRVYSYKICDFNIDILIAYIKADGILIF